MKKIKIKKLKEDDKYLVSDLMTNSLIEEYGEPPDSVNLNNLLDYYYLREDSNIFCLEISKVFAGFIWLIQSSDVITGTPFCCILYLAVKEEFRGKRYSKLLLNIARQFCLDNNIKELRLSVRNDNDIALNLYNTIGFKTNKFEMKLSLET